MARTSTATTGGGAPGNGSLPSLGRASVRMYRQGLGDCFLVTLPKEDGTPWRMLIDCGVILGTKDTGARLAEVVENLAHDTDGRVDVLVVTHEHYDHVAALAGPTKLFCGQHEARQEGQLQVGEVWFAWTEDPGDPLGRKLSKARADQVNRLAAMVGGLQSSDRAMTPATSDLANGMAELIGSFFGLDQQDFKGARDHLAGPGRRQRVGERRKWPGETSRGDGQGNGKCTRAGRRRRQAGALLQSERCALDQPGSARCAHLCSRPATRRGPAQKNLCERRGVPSGGARDREYSGFWCSGPRPRRSRGWPGRQLVPVRCHILPRAARPDIRRERPDARSHGRGPPASLLWA